MWPEVHPGLTSCCVADNAKAGGVELATQGPRAKETTPTEYDLRAYSVPQVLDRVAIGRTKLYEEIRTGRLATVKIGTRTLVTAQALREWLRQACNASVPLRTTEEDVR